MIKKKKKSARLSRGNIMYPSTAQVYSGDDPSMQRPPFGTDWNTKAARTCCGSFPFPTPP